MHIHSNHKRTRSIHTCTTSTTPIMTHPTHTPRRTHRRRHTRRRRHTPLARRNKSTLPHQPCQARTSMPRSHTRCSPTVCPAARVRTLALPPVRHRVVRMDWGAARRSPSLLVSSFCFCYTSCIFVNNWLGVSPRYVLDTYPGGKADMLHVDAANGRPESVLLCRRARLKCE